PGIEIEKLIHSIAEFEHLSFEGFHVYDGHHRDFNFDVRYQNITRHMEKVMSLYEMYKNIYPNIKLVTGGSPSFTSHSVHPAKICSPGTNIFWDWGYSDQLPEQKFKPATLI